MYILDINDIMIFIKSPESSGTGFSINNYVKFATGLALGNKLIQTRSPDNSSKFFIAFHTFGMLYLLSIIKNPLLG